METMTTEEFETEVARVGQGVPEHTMAALRRYACQRLPVGGFLRAVLSNKLVEAVQTADQTNQTALCDIVAFVHSALPADCWGSPEKVANWLHPPIHQ